MWWKGWSGAVSEVSISTLVAGAEVSRKYCRGCCGRNAGWCLECGKLLRLLGERGVLLGVTLVAGGGLLLGLILVTLKTGRLGRGVKMLSLGLDVWASCSRGVGVRCSAVGIIGMERVRELERAREEAPLWRLLVRGERVKAVAGRGRGSERVWRLGIGVGMPVP
jgi:hypothetical protein